jgi:hypothetical protein
MTDLDRDSLRQLNERKAVGNQCIGIAAGDARTVTPDERETYASDAVADILTALFGPAGSYVVRDDAPSQRVWSKDKLAEARAFLDRCYRSWEGDSEDYTITPA